MRSLELLLGVSCALMLSACAAKDEATSEMEPSQGSAPLLVGGDNCTTATFDGHNYWFCPAAQRSWVDAVSKCALVGAQLVRIDHPGENAFVKHNITADVWTGANDRSIENRWVWNAGDQLSNGPTAQPGYYTQWNPTEPNDLFGEDCAVLNTGGKWVDLNCVSNKGYVCESGPDACPSVPAKTQLGECGCAVPDVDGDGDGVSACFDQCPNSAASAITGACGCPNAPKPAGTACADGLFAGDKTCDGAGNCGRQDVCSVNPLCFKKTRGFSEYLFCHEPVTMPQARTKCAAMGMDLVSIESWAEDAFLYSHGHVIGLHWIGAQNTTPGSWAWVANGDTFWQSNAPVNGKYRNWLPTQPTLALGQCAIRDDLSGAWTGVPCGAAAGYICEIPDRCPTDPNKRVPGECGCGRSDGDANGDGIADCKGLTKLNDEPELDACLLTIGARPQIDTTIAAILFMDRAISLADYLAVSMDRTDKLDAIFASLTLCKAIQAGDRDGDLVPDSLDQCPSTPPVTPTDALGCTDSFRPEVPDEETVRAGVSKFAFARAKPGTCDNGSALTPELVAGYINNSQLAPAAAALFFNFLPRSCPVRLRVEVYTDDPNGWPIGGTRTLYFETGAQDLGPAYTNGTVVEGVRSLTLTNANFASSFQNVWSQMADSQGNNASGPAQYKMHARGMAVYGDGKQSAWSNFIELRTIGDR